MSAKVSGQVWELDLPPTDKLVLLALADHADHEGKNIRPGNELLCAKTGLSQQRVTQAIANFVKLGVLLPVNRKTGRTHKREFTLNTRPIKKRRYFKEKEEESYADSVPLAQKRHAQSVPLAEERYAFREEKVRPESGKVRPESEKVRFQTDAYKEVTVMNHHEPSVEKNEGSSPNSLLTVLLTAYQNIAKSQKELIQVSQQSELLFGDRVSEAELREWLEACNSYPSPAFIAQTFRRWKDAEIRRREKQRRESLVGASEEYKNQRLQGLDSASTQVGPPQPRKEIPGDISSPGNSNHSLWVEICERIKPELNHISFATWFAPTRGIELRGYELIVQVPDAVFEDYILNNYRDLLEQALPETVTSILFVTLAELNIEAQSMEEAAA